VCGRNRGFAGKDRCTATRPARTCSGTLIPALAGDYENNRALYPFLQEWLRTSGVPVLAVWGRNDEIFAAAGAEPSGGTHSTRASRWKQVGAPDRRAASRGPVAEIGGAFEKSRIVDGIHGTDAELRGTALGPARGFLPDHVRRGAVEQELIDVRDRLEVIIAAASDRAA
jgi:hypothetical protein